MIDAAPENWITHRFEYRRLAAGTREERKALSRGQPAAVQAARDWVDARIFDGAPDAVDMIVELAEAASTPGERSAVGIGLVEDLIHQHGDDAVASLLDCARRSPALTDAISWVSLASGSVSDESLAALSKYRRAH